MFDSFVPPKRVLMGPGPSDVHPRVLKAMGQQTIGHLDPAFVEMMDQVKAMLKYALQTDNEMTLPISAPGSAGMEACFVNLLEPGEKVVVCVNGVFGGRMLENVKRCGAVAVAVEDKWGDTVSLDKLERALAEHPDATLVAVVHAETSTGASSNIQAISELAHRNKCLLLVDAVTSLGGIPVRVDEWQIDALYSGTQKCLSCPPGLSPISMSAAAMKKIQNRKTPVQSWFLDLNLLTSYWSGDGARTYHHTAPVNALYGLHESLLMLSEEGLDAAWKRHRYQHEALSAGLERMGFEFIVKAADRLPQLNAIAIPAGMQDLASRKALLNEHGLEIGAGLGILAGKAWRIGLMGSSCDREHVELCLAALGSLVHAAGLLDDARAGVIAAQAFYQAH